MNSKFWLLEIKVHIDLAIWLQQMCSRVNLVQIQMYKTLIIKRHKQLSSMMDPCMYLHTKYDRVNK